MEEKKISLCKKNALVIGGTSSIGGELSKLLLENDCRVFCTGRHEPSFLCNKFFATDFSTLDFSIFSDSDFDSALKVCDILCVCYGPFLQKEIHEMKDDEWKKIALLDYALPGMLLSRVLPGMMERKFGRILLFGGTRTENVRPALTNAAYCGAKTGLSVLVKSLAQKYAQSGITCNAILPGFTRNAPGDARELSSLEVAEEGLHLLQNKNLNGVLLNVDAGWVR